MATFRAELQKKRKDGTINVKIVLTHGGIRKRIPTEIYITNKDLSRSGLIKNQSVRDKLNDIIKQYRSKCNDNALAIEAMNIEEVYNFVTAKDTTNLDFINIYREFIRDNQLKIKGIRNYRSALNSLISFLGRDKMDVSELSVTFLQKYSSSLHGRAQSLYLGSLRHVYEDAKLRYNDEERGIIRLPYSLFSKFKVPHQQAAEKRAIKLDTLRDIISLPYDKTSRGKDKENRFNLAKDMFVLSFCLMGMNSVDLYSCEAVEKGCIVYNRAKTKDRRADKSEMYVKIQPQIRDLVKKYHDYTRKRVFRFYQMYSSYSDFNKALNLGLKNVVKRLNEDIRERNKLLPDDSKIKEIDTIQFYAARHTWATIARNDVGIDKITINDALNHVDPSMRVTDLYIKKDFSAINEANDKVLKYVFNCPNIK